MSADLLSIFNNQMKMSVALVQKKFNKNVKKELKEKEPTRNFLEIIERICGEISAVFDESVKDSLVSHFNWDINELKGDFEKFLTTRINEERQNQMTLILQEVNKISEKGLSMQLNKILDRAETDMWAQIRTVFETAVDSAQEKLESYLKDFQSSAEEIKAKKVQLRNAAVEMVNKIMREKAGNIVWYMERKFNNKFKLDAQGVPRMWKPSDNIKQIYVDAKRDAEKLIDLFSIVRLNVDDDKLTQFKETETGVEALETPPDVPEVLVVLPLDQAVVQLERFRDQSQVPYLQALREQENAKTNSSVPLYFIILLLILGFDEFMAVIANPIYLILTIILGGVGYIIYKFNLTPFLMPVVRPIADVMLSSAATVSKTALDKYLANKNTPTPPPSNTTDSTTESDPQTKKDQ
jgi:vacuolar-type H+-ATPase subunit H